jgi:3-oxoadipate enol-lactonase
MNFTTSDGLNLFYTTTGDPADPALVLVHGLGADYRMYAPQVEAFAAAGWHVITPDLRGHGQSAAVAVFAVADCARDMAELLDHLGIAQAAFAGVSLGGLVVQQVAVDHPDRVTRLVVVDSYSSTRGLTRKLAGWTASAMFRLLPRNTLIGIMLTAYQGPEKAAVRDYLRECMQRMSRQQLIIERDAINSFEIVDRLPAVRVPTLVIAGDGFGAMAVNMARETADAIPGARFEVLPGGADPSNLIVPEAFNALALAFLAEASTTIAPST